VNSRKTRLPPYRLTSRENLDLVAVRENNKKSQGKKEKLKSKSTSKRQGKKRSGSRSESRQVEECEPKKAKKEKTGAKNSSGSTGSKPVQNEKVGGQIPEKTKKKAKKCKTTKSSSFAEDHTPCKFCGKRFNTPEDDKPEDDWIVCGSCQIWAHETCGEKQGIICDDQYVGL